MTKTNRKRVNVRKRNGVVMDLHIEGSKLASKFMFNNEGILLTFSPTMFQNIPVTELT